MLCGLDRGADGSLGGHEDDREGRLQLPEVSHQLEAVHAGHADVTDDDVEREAATRLERRGAAGRELAPRVAPAEDVGDGERHLVIVIDDEHRSIGHDAKRPSQKAKPGHSSV